MLLYWGASCAEQKSGQRLAYLKEATKTLLIQCRLFFVVEQALLSMVSLQPPRALHFPGSALSTRQGEGVHYQGNLTSEVLLRLCDAHCWYCASEEPRPGRVL